MRKFFKLLLIAALLALGAWLLWDAMLSEQVDLSRYPIKYSQIIESAAEEYEVPKEIVYAIVHTESAFDPEAVSRVGAKGLMQIIDDTNDWIALKLGEEAMPHRLFEPEFNVRRGTWLLSYLYNEFGSWEIAFAAYNAGYGRVRSWLADTAYSSDGVTLDYIPFAETREYVKRASVAAEKYRELYFE